MTNVTLTEPTACSWDWKCDGCRRLVRAPARLLIVGDYGFELCPCCVAELLAAAAATR